MANRNNMFALLLAGLDEGKSADLINEQLRNQVAKELDQLSIDFVIDESKFENLSNFLKGVTTDIGLAKKEAEELSNLVNILNSSKNFRANISESAKPLIEAATLQTGYSDFTIVKQEIDTQTKQVQGLTLEFQDLHGFVQRVRVAMSEMGQINVSESTKLTSTLNADLKEQDQILQKLRKEQIALNVERQKKGATPELEAQLMQNQAQTMEVLANRQQLISQARQASIISVQTETELLRQQQQQQVEFQNTLNKKVDQTVEADRWSESSKALKDYATIYNQVIDLDIKRSVQEDKFSAPEQERRIALNNELIELEKLIDRYPELKTELESVKAAGLKASEVKLADEEVKQAAIDIKELNKLYNQLYQYKDQIAKGKLQSSLSNETQAHIELADSVEKEIKALENRMQTRNQTGAGEEAVLRGLEKVHEEVANKELLHIGKSLDLYEAKGKHIEKIAGALKETPSTDGILALGDSLQTSSPVLEKFATEIYGAKAEIRGLTEVTDDYGNKYHKIVIAQDKTANQVKLTTLTIDKQAGSVRTLGDTIQNNIARQVSWIGQMGHAIRKMSIWGVAARALYGSVRQVGQGFAFVKELDKDLTQAAIVTGKTRSQVKGLADEYSNLALQMGKTVSEISKVNTELLRQGLTVRESGNRLETILKLSSTGQITTQDALQVVTAAVNAMQESHTKAADVILRASNISASSVEQLGEAFTKTASSAFATGMEIEQVTGILATMLEVTQEGPSQLGTSLKTILARFSRVNEETGEWNENLNDVQKAIESVGIKFTDTDGQIRNVYNILEDLSAIWPTLTKNQQAYIATTSAGVRMQNRFFAVMNNFDRVKTITEETGKAAGTMNRAYLTYMDSVEASSNRMKASLEQLYINTINSDFIKWLYDSGTNFIRVVDQIGIMNLAVMGIIAYLLKQKPLMQSLSLITGSMFGIDKVAANAAYSASLKMVGDSLASAKMNSLGFIGTTKMVAVTAKGAAASLWTMLKPMLAAAGIIGAVVVALAAVGRAIKSIIDAQKEEKKQLIDLNNTYLEHQQSQEANKATLQDLGSQYDVYIKKIEKAGTSAKAALTGEEYQDFLTIQDQITDVLPDATMKTDRYGNSIIDMTEGVKGLTDQYESYLKQLDNDYVEKLPEILDNNAKEVKKIQKEIAENTKKIAGEGSGHRLYSEEEIKGIQRTNSELKERQDLLNAQNVAMWIEGQDAAVRSIEHEGVALTEVQRLLLMSPDIYQQVSEAQITSYEELDTFLTKTLDSSANVYSELNEVYLGAEQQIKDLNKAKSDGEIGDRLYEYRLNQIIKGFGQSADSIEMTTEEQENYNIVKTEAINKLNTMKMSLNEEEQAIMTATERLAKAEQATADYTKILEEYNKNQRLSADTRKQIINDYPELIAYMGDEKTLIKEVEKRRVESDGIIIESYKNKMEAQLMVDEVFYTEHIKMNTQLFDELQKKYDVDLENVKTLAEAKLKVENTLINQLAKRWEEFFTKSAIASEGYVHIMGEFGMVNERGLTLAQALAEEQRKVSDHFKGIVRDRIDLDLTTTITKDSQADKTAKEYAELTLDQYAALNAELAVTSQKLDELAHLENMLDEDDHGGRYLITQQRNEAYTQQLDIYTRLIAAKEAEAQTYTDRLQEVKILDETGKLAENYLDIMAGLNSEYLGSVDAVEEIENAFQSWFNLTYSEIPGLNNSLNATKENLHEITRAAQKAREEISQMAEDYVKDWVKFSVDREIDGIERKIAIEEEAHSARLKALQNELDQMKQSKDIQDEQVARAEKLLSIQKQADELERAKNRRNLRILTTEGQYDWVANPEIVAQEQDKLKSLQEDYAKWEQDNIYQKSIKAKEEEIRKETEAFEHFRETQQRRIQVLNDMLSQYEIRTSEFFDKQIPGWEEMLNTITIDHESSFLEMESQVESLITVYERLIAVMKQQKEAELYAAQMPIAPNTVYVNAGGSVVDAETAWTQGLGAATGSNDIAKQNEARLAADAEFLASEIARANAVIAHRTSQSMDTSAQEKYLQRLISGSYAKGGEIKSSGLHLAEFHGTQNDPEWIFNSAQLATVLKQNTLDALELTLPEITNLSQNTNTTQNEQVFHINKLEFPNVKTAEEIKEAILNLPSLAKMKVRTS